MTEQCKRVRAAQYEFTTGGQTFEIYEVQASERMGRPLWHVRVKGERDAFDAAETLREAKEWARRATQPEGKPLVDIL
jgi:hypothetical protein